MAGTEVGLSRISYLILVTCLHHLTLMFPNRMTPEALKYEPVGDVF